MTLKPALHVGVLAGGVVIADPMDLQIGENGLIEEAEKLEPFLMAVPLLAQTVHLPVSGIQGSEQRRRAIAPVIMRHGLAGTGFERQARLRTVEAWI